MTFKYSAVAFALAALLILLSPTTGIHADQDPPARLISLEFIDKPLKQVLADLARLSGMEIFVNEEFADMTVSGELYEVTVDEALKRIIRNQNHTIIYETGNKIMLYVYEKGSPTDKSDMHMVPAHEWLGPRSELPAAETSEPPAGTTSPETSPEASPGSEENEQDNANGEEPETADTEEPMPK